MEEISGNTFREAIRKKLRAAITRSLTALTHFSHITSLPRNLRLPVKARCALDHTPTHPQHQTFRHDCSSLPTSSTLANFHHSPPLANFHHVCMSGATRL